MHHDLKTWPQFFDRVKDGSKTFEFRANDRGFQSGDTITLKEFDPEMKGKRKPYTLESTPGDYTGRQMHFYIGYVLPISADHVCFSIIPRDGASS